MPALRILICPLDWGLGHAVRCIPIIRALQKAGAVPVIAADGSPLNILRSEFPDAEWIRFPGVQITYPKKGSLMPLSMALQTPAQLSGITRERKFIRKTVQDLRIDGIISDNRYGAVSDEVPSVFITHQLNILTGNRFSDSLAKWLNRHFTSAYGQIWIPDYVGSDNLSGKLSHGKYIPENARYIGPLSRFDALSARHKEFDAALVLSGPEPQRTLLENIFLQQASALPQKKFLLIRGKAGLPESCPAHVKVIPLASGQDILIAYASAEKIICRSGYTSVMELCALGKSAHLIPTPGQTEQEYLAQYLSSKGYFSQSRQSRFDLESVLNSDKKTALIPPGMRPEISILENEISRWLNSISHVAE